MVCVNVFILLQLEVIKENLLQKLFDHFPTTIFFTFQAQAAVSFPFLPVM